MYKLINFTSLHLCSPFTAHTLTGFQSKNLHKHNVTTYSCVSDTQKQTPGGKHEFQVDVNLSLLLQVESFS